MTSYRGLPRPQRCAVMGVLNVTPDSFSDGGRYLNRDDAIAHAHAMVAAGADIIDVGGESTRPGAERVDAATEADRIVPIIKELAADGVRLSVDTTRAAVAAAAVEAGATVINDVSGGLADPDMARVAAEVATPWVLMHWRGPSAHMDALAAYSDVVFDVRNELRARVEAALAHGVAEHNIVLDPGLGFAKDAEHNWQLLNQLNVLVGEGFPVLVGASRKRFLGSLLAGDDGAPRDPHGREDATTAISTLAAANGAWGVRVHRVRPSLDAVKVAAAWGEGRA